MLLVGQFKLLVAATFILFGPRDTLWNVIFTSVKMTGGEFRCSIAFLTDV